MCPFQVSNLIGPGLDDPGVGTLIDPRVGVQVTTGALIDPRVGVQATTLQVTTLGWMSW